ncbi:ATP-dependent DNA helicase RecG [Gloeocapsa sp. PCC 73106]|uniref:ATP-dependent DNA helicase RecG n=1 Tax=Gloeocapsa sp. PCC 73106 TaxID=102232 RepID=UPI0002ACAF11|nr:ATP-dependent DNA helicase RecG [Gloeocapsa sp. PCC 73106]ELR99179.1 ATP-dependent DNA helicase RecG [Gloeocapsa sp. PCC 73106]
MSVIQPDWLRLQKALSVEVENDFIDIQGRNYRFSEFLSLNFSQVPPLTNSLDQQRWQKKAQEFAQYSQLTYDERRTLVADTRRFLRQLQQEAETTVTPTSTKIAKTSLPSQSRGGDIKLEQPLTQIIGSTKSKYLERLGLVTVQDVLFYYPRDHIDYARQVYIKDLVEGETVTILGRVKRCNCFTSPKNQKLTIFELTLSDRTGELKLNRYYPGNRYQNRGWPQKLKLQYPIGSAVAASGLVKKNKYGFTTLENPEIELMDSPGAAIESPKIGRLLPVYPLTEGVAADLVRNTVIIALGAVKQIKETLPSMILEKYSLMRLTEAIANIHFPPDSTSLTQARRRLVFDEFFYLQLAFLRRRQSQRQQDNSAIFSIRGELIEQFQELLPFELTSAQKRVIQEILPDLESSTPMNRLVQGDVGSGKTVVGVFAILAAIQSGYQTALMAPTEVLAEQHYHKIVTWFNLLHLPVELLTGSTKTAKRRDIYAQLSTGELPLIVGTHALIQDSVNFLKLGLVVIDEQHRFGVNQRASLLAKGNSPHILSMTATPIPRTLALTLHGDLDVSQIDELPPGRQPIQTTLVTGRQRTQAYDLIRREIAQGRQAYIILPMIEESEKLDVRAAVAEHQRLSEQVFKGFQVGLLHGRLTSAEKEQSLREFRESQTQIIVSTTVIEVGVDVPNATVMLIENAERFGLSQLHQLRGRVGRGSHKSYCLLVLGNNAVEARQRLEILEKSQDGFFISEMDLQLRGPGEVLGKRQSGLPDFALASLVEDQEVLNLARDAAATLILQDHELKDYFSIRSELERRLQKMLGAEILN